MSQPESQPIVATPSGQVMTELRAEAVEIGKPDQRVTNVLWLVIVFAAALIALGSVGALVASMFMAVAGPTRPELILSIFTGSFAFLGGLLVPRPGP